MKGSRRGGRGCDRIGRRPLIAGGAFLLLAGARPARGEDPFETLKLFRPRRPSMAPDFTIPGLDAPHIRLRDFKSHVVLLNFWATWCPPCREEMPSMERLSRRFRSRMFTILAVSIDSRGEEVVRPFVKSLGLTFPIGLDPKMSVAGEYRVAGLPTSILIDGGGGMAAVAIGARDWNSPEAHGVIEGLLGGRAGSSAEAANGRQPAKEGSR